MNRWFPQCLAQFAALIPLGRKLGRVLDLFSSRRLTPPLSHRPSLFLASHAGELSSSPLKKPPGEGTGPTIHADFRGILVGRVPSRGKLGVLLQAAWQNGDAAGGLF